MKSLRILAISVLALVGLASCQPEPELPKPEIKLGQTEVVLTSEEGASMSVGYLVENGVEGESITVEENAEWLTVSTAKVRTLEFTATFNNTGEVRSEEVKISYKGAESVTITVRQEQLASPLTIEISEVTATEVVFSVTTTDSELTWYPAVVSKEYDDYYTDEQMVETDIEWLQYYADNQDTTLELILEQVLVTGNLKDVYFDGLEPATEYVLYAYGLSYEAERTTELVKVNFTTEKAWEGDITVNFDVTEKDHVIYYSATPSHTGVPYYCYYATERQFEQWKVKYGTDDVKQLIEKGSIGEIVEGLTEVGFFDEIGDFYDFFNATGSIRDNYFPCKASTKYIFFAVKWNEKCELLGEVSLYEYTTQPVEPSDNQITLSVSNVTQSTATVTATVTNDDPYIIYPVETALLEGKSAQELADYMEEHYFLSEFTFSGNKTREYSSLNSATDYTFVAFGYKAKSINTADISTVRFHTQSSSDPAECTFGFDYQVYEESVWVKVTPSDMGHWYYWGVFDARFTSDDVKTYISDVLIKDGYEGDAAVWASWWLKKGVQVEEVGGLNPSTEYRVAVVIMDYNTGEFLTDVTFSETFKTPDPVIADLKINVKYDKYYDLDELAAAGYSQYKEDVANDSRFNNGGAILPTEIMIEGAFSRFSYYVVRRDLTNTTDYPDSIFIRDMIEKGEGSTAKKTIFPITYDEYWTVAAVAMDRQGNFTSVYRKKIFLTKDGVSPVSEFIASQSGAPVKAPSVIEWNNYNDGKVGVRTPSKEMIAPVEVVDIRECNLEGWRKSCEAEYAQLKEARTANLKEEQRVGLYSLK